MSRDYQRWLPEHDRILLSMRAGGASYDDVEAAVGHTRDACRQRMVDLRRREERAAYRAANPGAKEPPKDPDARRKFTAEDDAAILRLLDEGRTQGQIAIALDRSTSSISNRVNRLRAKDKARRNPPPTPGAPAPKRLLPLDAGASPAGLWLRRMQMEAA